MRTLEGLLLRPAKASKACASGTGLPEARQRAARRSRSTVILGFVSHLVSMPSTGS